MELKELILKLRKYRMILIPASIAGLAIGIATSFYPPRYVSSGSFYVRRAVNESLGFFTYEGYYAQQTAISYTNSVSALAESQDLKKTVLEEIGSVVNKESLRELNKSTRVKKVGPQIISITVKSADQEKSKNLWMEISRSLIEKSKELNLGGDENLSILPISQQPLVKETYRSSYVFGLVGMLAGFSTVLFFICLKEYFKR